MVGGRGAVIGRREIFWRERAGRIGPERELGALCTARTVVGLVTLRAPAVPCSRAAKYGKRSSYRNVGWRQVGLWRVGSGAHEGGFQQKAPFVAGVGVPESLGHLLSRLERLALKASVARGIAWWWGSLACGKVAPGCELGVACADLLRLKFEREGTGSGWGLGRRESGCGVGGCCALRSYFLRCLCSIYWYMPRCDAS